MSEPGCINLEKAFPEFRISFDEAREKGKPRDPWYMVIRGKLGCVYPFGGNRLAADVTGRYARQAAMSLPYVETWQRCDDVVAVTFDVHHAREILELVQAHRKPDFSEAQKAKLAGNFHKF